LAKAAVEIPGGRLIIETMDRVVEVWKRPARTIAVFCSPFIAQP
jgi:hypothetical protein